MSIPIETVNCGTFTMDYFRFGTGKKPFVILPGLSVQSVMHLADTVAEAYSQFGTDCTVYVFDRRKELPTSYPVREAARDTAEAIKTLGLSDIYLFGASQGGMMAMEIAVNCPELVRKLALGSTSSRITEKQFAAVEQWIGSAKEGNGAELYLAFGREIYARDMFEKLKNALMEAGKTVTAAELKRFITLAEGIKGFSENGLWKIKCPVLVTGSDDDAVLGPKAYEEIREKLKDHPSAEFCLYDGYGHASFDTAPDYKERLVRFFLS